MNVIIGITGKMHSGKDTVASILRYIYSVGISKAKYAEWYSNYSYTNKSTNTTKSSLIYHFADKLKDLAAITFSIDRTFFDNQDYKDKYYYDFRNGIFIFKDNITMPNIQRLSISDFCCLEDIKKNLIYNPNIPYIKLRTIMQLYGDAMRNIFGKNFFINLVIKDIETATKYGGLAIVPDVRFPEEADALRKSINNRAYIIEVRRNKNTENTSDHISEKINIKPNYIIHNDSTYFSLFYSVLQVYSNILKYEENLKKINNI